MKDKLTLGDKFVAYNLERHGHITENTRSTLKLRGNLIDDFEHDLMKYWNKNGTFEGLELLGIGEETMGDIAFLVENRKEIPGIRSFIVHYRKNKQFGERYYGNRRDGETAIQIATYHKSIITTYNEEGNLKGIEEEDIPKEAIKTLEGY